LCGTQANLQRQEIGRMLREWERQHPGRVETTFAALSRLVPSHLMDRTRFDFASLLPTGIADPAGDRAFDPEMPEVAEMAEMAEHLIMPSLGRPPQ
jgi:tRNA 2-thiocytidine biosynthesis protein TtcA